MTYISRSSQGKTVKMPGRGPENWLEPGSCLARTSGLEGHLPGGMNCLKLFSRQQKQLVIFYGTLMMDAKTETELDV